MGMCHPKGYGFGAVLFWNKIMDFAFLVWNRVWLWQGSMNLDHMFIFCPCYFDIDQAGHSFSKQLRKITNQGEKWSENGYGRFGLNRVRVLRTMWHPPAGGMPVIQILNGWCIINVGPSDRLRAKVHLILKECKVFHMKISFHWHTNFVWINLIFTREAACTRPRFETEAKIGKGHLK